MLLIIDESNLTERKLQTDPTEMFSLPKPATLVLSFSGPLNDVRNLLPALSGGYWQGSGNNEKMLKERLKSRPLGT